MGEELVSGICADGPLAGNEVTIFNSLGASVTIGSISSDKTKQREACIYEVVALASGDELAVLRFVRTAKSQSYPQATLRATSDLGDEMP